MRKSGQPHELACVLCSLLIGLGYDAYIVFGYATRDVTLRIMSRVDSPCPLYEEKIETQQENAKELKYLVKPPRDLRSKFLMMIEQKKKDKILEQEKITAEEERKRKEVCYCIFYC